MWGPNKPAYGRLLPKRRNMAKPVPSDPVRSTVRNAEFEAMLCTAIARGLLVALRYKQADGVIDRKPRTFGPSAVYYSEQHIVCVVGEEVLNPNDAGAGRSVQKFEVGKIAELQLGDNAYHPSQGVDYARSKFRNGFICKAQHFAIEAEALVDDQPNVESI